MSFTEPSTAAAGLLYTHAHCQRPPAGALHALNMCLLLSVNQFPAEEVRRALGDRIQLTENQVQVMAPVRVFIWHQSTIDDLHAMQSNAVIAGMVFA